jgi:hypothetical protein
MKKSLITALLSIPAFVYSQTEMGNFAHVTPKKDTLFLLENDPLTKLTFNVWKSDSTWNGQNPTIVFVNREDMEAIKFTQFRASNEFVRMRKTPNKTKNK